MLIPMALIGLGIGALASQLGAVTVSSFPDTMSAEIGGLQNTFTNFGASLGTALVGAVLIGSLSTTFLAGVSSNPAIPADVVSQSSTTLEAGIPFVSDAQLQKELSTTTLSPEAQQAIVDENASARLVGLRAALSVVALVIVAAIFFARLIPTESLTKGASPDAGRRRRRDASRPGLTVRRKPLEFQVSLCLTRGYATTGAEKSRDPYR